MHALGPNGDACKTRRNPAQEREPVEEPQHMRRRSGIHSTGQDGAEHAVLHKHLEAPRNVCREIAPVMNTWSHVVISRTRSAPKGSESATSVPRPSWDLVGFP